MVTRVIKGISQRVELLAILSSLATPCGIRLLMHTGSPRLTHLLELARSRIHSQSDSHQQRLPKLDLSVEVSSGLQISTVFPVEHKAGRRANYSFEQSSILYGATF